MDGKDKPVTKSEKHAKNRKTWAQNFTGQTPPAKNNLGCLYGLPQ